MDRLFEARLAGSRFLRIRHFRNGTCHPVLAARLVLPGDPTFLWLDSAANREAGVDEATKDGRYFRMKGLTYLIER